MTATINPKKGVTVLKSAVVAIQVQAYESGNDFLEKFGIALPEPEVAESEVKLLLIGGNSLKYSVKTEDVGYHVDIIKEQLGWL